jgi:hypothetical protein
MTTTTKDTDKYRDKAADKSATPALSRPKPAYGSPDLPDRPAGGRKKQIVPEISCAVFRGPLACCPCLLTTTGGVTGRRHRAEGASQEEQQVRDKNKKRAIVRVCQLRMIVWLVDPPLVSSASHPHPNRGPPKRQVLPAGAGTPPALRTISCGGFSRGTARRAPCGPPAPAR